MLNTLETISKIYAFAELDMNKVDKFRLVVKKKGRAEGRTGGDTEEDPELVWYTWKEFEGIIKPKFNKQQVFSLPTEANDFLRFAKDSMEYFGYL